jgi:hypothetical protein
MSPTFKNENGYRFFTWSNVESRMYIHIGKGDNRAKVWLEPIIEIAEKRGFTEKQLNKIIEIVAKNEKDFKTKYRAHIG